MENGLKNHQDDKCDLIKLYQQMADLTLPKCKQCRIPLSCCSPEYCSMAIDYAQERYGVTLISTGHKTLPLMGVNGCTVAPHLRPMCTMHVCSINSMGCDTKDLKWTEEYFALRDQIDEKEYDCSELCEDDL